MEEILEDEKYISERIKFLKTIRNLFILIKKILIIFLIGYIILNYVFGLLRMKDESMYPEISEGELIFFTRMEKEYKIKDVIAFKMNDKSYVSRIVALPGDIVDLTNNNEVTINGNLENYNPFYQTVLENAKIQFPYTVSENTVFVLQDYRVESQDSRVFGAIPFNSIEGKIIGKLKIRNF